MTIQCDTVFLQVISFGKCAHTKQKHVYSTTADTSVYTHCVRAQGTICCFFL